MNTIKTPSRDHVAAASGGSIVIFDCLECAKGKYHAGASGRPHCNRCGAPLPDDLLDTVRSYQTVVNAA